MIEIDRLIRSKRKTLSLIVEIDGTLTVRAPMKMRESDIWKFIEAKADWIRRKQAKVQKEAVLPHQYVDGETFLYLGQEIPLRLVSDQKPALVMGSVFNLTKSARPNAESVFEAWYRQQARKLIGQRMTFFARNHDFAPKKLRISSARTRWGSCSTKGTLSFTWRLVMAPPDAIDYVIVHELCHLKEMNHSKAFWTQVEKILPDYKRHRTWLKKNGSRLK